MVQLHQDREKFKEKGIKIIVVCPENEEKIKKYLDKEPLDLVFVADPTHTLADFYKQQVKIFKFGRLPAQILLDKDRNTVFEHFATSMKDVVENERVFKWI